MHDYDKKIKEDIKKQYDTEALVYGQEFQSSVGKYFMQKKIETTLKIAGFQKGDKILEVACANGVYTFEFAKKGFNITGVDLSPKCIEVAKASATKMHVENVDFLVADIEDLSMFSANSFDGAISFSTLRYVPSPEKAIFQIYRLLKPNKTFVADFPNKLCPWFKVIKPFIFRKKHIHDHVYYIGEIIDLFYRTGFTDINVQTILFSAPHISVFTLPYEKFMEKLTVYVPFLKKFAGIIICRGIKK
jgi:ubiquinone/menaquinone biosynthesis C-methylase UbiE